MIVLFFSKTKQFSRNPFECQLNFPKYWFLETQNTVLTETELMEKFMIEILVLFSACLGKFRRRLCQSRVWVHLILFAPNLRLYKGNGPCTVGQQGKLKNQTRLVFNVSFAHQLLCHLAQFNTAMFHRTLAQSLYGFFPVPIGQFISVTFPRRTGGSAQTKIACACVRCFLKFKDVR